jgi:hypothetical protein
LSRFEKRDKIIQFLLELCDAILLGAAVAKLEEEDFEGYVI